MGVQQFAEGVRVLAQQEDAFRADFVADLQGADVLRQALREHAQLTGRGDFARRGVGLQLEGDDLFGKVEQQGVLFVDLARAVAEVDQRFFHLEQLLGVLVGLFPGLDQGLQLRLHAVRRGRHHGVAEDAALAQLGEVAREFGVRGAQLLERRRFALDRQARGLGQTLREHAQFAGGSDVAGVVRGLAVVVVLDAGDEQGQDDQDAAEDLQLLGDAVLAEEAHRAAAGRRRGCRLSGIHDGGGGNGLVGSGLAPRQEARQFQVERHRVLRLLGRNDAYFDAVCPGRRVRRRCP